MELEWKRIHVFFDANRRLIGNPLTFIEKIQGLVSMPYTEELKYPYNEQDLYIFLIHLLSICHTDRFLNEISSWDEYKKIGKNGIQKHMHARSWNAATKDLAMIDVFFQKNKGYTVTPTKKNFKMKGAFDYDKTHAIRIETSDAPEKLASAFLELMEYVMQNDLLQRPVEIKKP